MNDVHHISDVERMHEFFIRGVSYLPYILIGVFVLIIASFLFNLYEMNFSKDKNVIQFMKSFLGDCIFLMMTLILLLLFC